MFYKLVFIIVAISFFSFNCKGADKNMDKKGKETAEMHRRASQQTKKGSIYKYNDGSGNLYIISSNKIIYDPIPKHMTSTGFTDNGKRINKEITKDQYSKIAGEYKKLFENKKIHINKRLMGSGILKIEDYTDTKNNKKVLISNCDEKRDFEKLLKSLL